MSTNNPTDGSSRQSVHGDGGGEQTHASGNRERSQGQPDLPPRILPAWAGYWLAKGFRSLRGLFAAASSDMALLVALAVGSLSLVTTAIGVGSIFTDGGWLVTLLVGLPFSAVISAAVFAFWIVVLRKDYDTRGEGTFFLSLALVASLTSAAFASGVTSFVASQASYDAEVQSVGLASMVSPLGNLQDNSSNQSMALLSTSSKMSAAERQEEGFGNSCLGPATPKICGVRCLLRRRLAEEAKAHSDNVAAIATESTAIVSDTGAVLNQDEWRTLYRRGASLVSDSRIAEARAWAIETREGFRSGFVDPDSGKAFECRDPDAENDLSNLITVLSNSPDFPISPPIFAESSFAYVVGANLKTLQDMLLSPTPFGEAYDQADAQRMMPAFLLALLIEAFVVGGLKLHAKQKGQKFNPKNDDGNSRLPRKKWVILPERGIPSHQKGRVKKLVSTILSHSVEDVSSPDALGKIGARRYLFKPVGVNGNLEKIELVRAELGLEAHDAWPGPVNIDRIPQAAYDQISTLYPDAKQVQFFPFSAQQEERLRQLLSALAG